MYVVNFTLFRSS